MKFCHSAVKPFLCAPFNACQTMLTGIFERHKNEILAFFKPMAQK